MTPRRRVYVVYAGGTIGMQATGSGYAPVPVETFKQEWLRRRLKKTVHLTKGGCLGPCTLANVVSLMFDGRSVWFHSVNAPAIVTAIFDYIDTMLAADAYLPPPPSLTAHVFSFYDWERRTPHGD